MIDKNTSLEFDRELAILKQEIEEQLERIRRDSEVVKDEWRHAIADGDLRENAAYDAAVDEMKSLREEEVKLLTQLEDIKAADPSRYRPIGLITPYSTVLLQINTTEVHNMEMTIKLFPGNISNMEKGIVSCGSRLGKQLMKKKVGDVVNISDLETSGICKYKILELY